MQESGVTSRRSGLPIWTAAPIDHKSCNSFAFVSRLGGVRAAARVCGSVGVHLRAHLSDLIVAVAGCAMLVGREMMSLMGTRGEVVLLLIATAWAH